MTQKLYYYNNIVTFTDFTLKDLKHEYEQLAGRVFGVPYVLYEKWDTELEYLRNYLLEKRYPYIDFLLSQFIRYRTDDNVHFLIPYLPAINKSPIKEDLYLEWVSRDRLGIKDFSLYFFDSTLLVEARTDADRLRRIKDGHTLPGLIKQAKNCNLSLASYVYFFDSLKSRIDELKLSVINEILLYAKQTGLYDKMKIIYENRESQ